MMQTQDGRVKRGRQARNTGASQLANQHIGERIRLRRTLLGLSQTELGKALGLSFQQMQKYERGTSSIGAGQLCGIAKALDVPVSFFYDGLDGVSVPMNSDAGERQYRLVRDEIEVLGHYRAAPDFIQEAIRSLLGYLSNQNSRQDRDFAGDAEAQQEVPAADSPPADGTGQAPIRDGAGPHSVMEESRGVGAGAEPDRQDVGELPESVPPESGQALSEPREQPVPARRPRGRPRKVADTAQAEPVPVLGRPGESAAFAAEASPPKLRNERDIVREPGDVVPPEEKPPNEPDLPRPGSRGGNKRTPGATSAGKPKRAKSGTPASGKPNRRNTRRTYGATWSPSDIGK